MDISVQGLVKKYGFQKAVNEISFDVKSGEVLGFLGPNGAGKTTTMKIITCYMAPSDGDVKVGGKSILTDQDAIKQHIGYLPEHNPLYLDMPIIEYLGFAAEIQGVKKGKVSDQIRKMVRLCGLDKEKHKKIRELSKGYRQRVGLAQAMIHDPEILVLDEPTTGLDPNQIVEIRELIRELGREKTVILSTHILPEVEATCDRIVIINDGVIVADGAPKELRKQARGAEVTKLRIVDGDVDSIYQGLQSLPSVAMVDVLGDGYFQVESLKDFSARRDIFKSCVAQDWVLMEMTPIEQNLEDIFRNVTLG